MASRWNHLVCDPCWRQMEGAREPVRVRNDDPQPCCFCPTVTTSGIYVRRNPEETPCKGTEKVHVE